MRLVLTMMVQSAAKTNMEQVQWEAGNSTARMLLGMDDHTEMVRGLTMDRRES